MRALSAPNATSPLAWVDLPSLPLRPHQVRIQVRAVGVNPVDWKMRDYEFLGVVQRLLGPRGPVVVGIDVAGVVTEVGSRVRDVSVGDRVVGSTDFAKGERGSYAEEAVISEANCAKLPDSIPFDVAGALPVAGATAWMAVNEIGAIPTLSAPRVLVLGASGGVGHLAVQIARNSGARVVGVCSTRNVAFVEGLGATAIDYTAGDVAAAARDLGPHDLIVDAVGTQPYPRAWSRALLAPKGNLVHVVPRGADLPAIALLPRVHTVLGRANRTRLEALLADIVAGRLTVHIAERLPLGDAERAQQISRTGKVVGKIVLVA